MKRIRGNGVELACFEHGRGDETVVFSHSYLVDHHHFDAQIEALAGRFRVIAYDHRDHGGSDRTPGRYAMNDLVSDAIEVIRQTGSAPCHFVGLSTGGFVGLRLALRAPELLRSLIVMDTSADAEPLAKRLKYEAMFGVLRTMGFGPLMPTITKLMFGPALLDSPERADELNEWVARMRDNDPKALVRFGRAIFGRDDLGPHLSRIDIPTLVVVGEHDRPQPPSRARRIAEGITGAELAEVPGAGHLSTVDAPEFVNRQLISFLNRHTGFERPSS